MSGSITSVDKLRPNAKGMSLIVKVVDAKVVVDRKGPKGGSKIAECIVGDVTGAIVLQARDDQVDVAQPGAYIRLEGAKIDVFRGSMRLVVGKDGKVEVVEGEDFRPAVGNNMSLIEFEMVTLPTAGEQPSA
uniref:Single-stranded DNA binding protein Ssb-like OB fold domain-containing protein n=1 Tax=Chlamydomonas euryale TaxID=1486919 RepID=A0A7R9VFT2_9CHLO